MKIVQHTTFVVEIGLGVVLRGFNCFILKYLYLRVQKVYAHFLNENNVRIQWTGMSDSNREQHPLLYEDLSEEEHLSTHFQTRVRPMVFRGRARNNAKGAAAIIRLWPEHWSSSVTYWWIGLGMIAIITFVIYNSIAALAIIPADNFRIPRARFLHNMKEVLNEDSLTSNCVFMHLFVEPNGKIDLDNYLPYIDIIAAKYPDFNYHLIVVTDDTALEGTTLSAEESNDIALNLLWSQNKINRNNKVNIIHITLSKYLDNSPLREYWRSVPKQFIQFLTRAVSIWDKGGVAFNPTILTPRSPNSIYIEKLQKILENYQSNSKNERKSKKTLHQGYKRKVNNIRDIIDALEQNDMELSTLSQQNPIEAESQDHRSITNSALITQLNTKVRSNGTTNQLESKASFANTTYYHTTLYEGNDKESVNKLTTNDTTTVGLIPKFPDFLIQNKPVKEIENNFTNEKNIALTRRRKHVIPELKNKAQTFKLDKFDKGLRENIQPVIIAAKILQNDSFEVDLTTKDKKSYSQFTIDLKGNIIGSIFPCHAFIGTIFSHSVRYGQESVTDFIITEVSTFCKGVLSSCNGIDVILL